MTDTGKFLVIQVLAVLLTPASIALTLFLIERDKAPRPDIQYVSALPLYTVIEPSSGFVTKINDDPGLSSDFRNEIRQASLSKDNPEMCTSWLDGGSWDNDCLAIYKSVINQMDGMLKGIVVQGHGSVQEARARNSVRNLQEFKRELTKVENTALPRAGGVTLNVGVLNAGDSAGTIFAEGLLKFNNQVMHVSTENYTAIGAHGFSEVPFTTAREDGGKLLGTYKNGEEPIVKAWSDLVKSGNEIPFELTITLSGKKEAIKGSVPKEE